MARKKKEEDAKAGEGWLVTFSDLMTLLLTFFVLLLSMAVIDERRKLVVLGSVSGTFGSGEAHFNPLANSEGPAQSVEPGAMQASANDLAALRDQLHDDPPGDLNFMENPYVQVFSINADAMFAPGQAELTERGYLMLRRILPTLVNVDAPIMVAGHTSPSRDEQVGLLDSIGPGGVQDTWMLSMSRSLAVYRALTEMGMPNEMLQLEAFGMYRPRYDNRTASGRRDNRRVDIVLDKRGRLWFREDEVLRREHIQRETFQNERFIFEFDLRRTNPGGR